MTPAQADASQQPLWQRLKDRFVRYASEPDDLPEVKLRKTLGIAINAVGLPVWLLYAAIWFAVDARLAGQVCIATVCGVVLFSLLYRWMRNYTLLIGLLGVMQQLAFLGVHIALGGFTSSPYLLIYIFVQTLLVPFTDDPRRTKYWFAWTVVLALIAGFAEPYISHGGFLSPGVLTALTVSIILGFAAFALLPALIYGQRIQRIELEKSTEREAHLAQTQAALARQTATAEVLRVISGSMADTQPVLEKIVDSCAHLFEAAGIAVMLVDAGGLVHLPAFRVIDTADGPEVWRPENAARSLAYRMALGFECDRRSHGINPCRNGHVRVIRHNAARSCGRPHAAPPKPEAKCWAIAYRCRSPLLRSGTGRHRVPSRPAACASAMQVLTNVLPSPCASRRWCRRFWGQGPAQRPEFRACRRKPAHAVAHLQALGKY